MNFTDLLKRASSNTAQQQAELAKQEKERQIAKKAAEEAEQRRQAELRRLADERRKEREERERKEKEQEARKARPLPKTTNLWALKKERQRLGLDPDGKDDHLIEGATLDQKPKSYKELLSKANSTAKASSSSLNGKGKGKEKEPVVLSRAEKAQRKQNALFNDDEPSSGAFALAKAKKRSDASSSSRPSPPTIPALKRTASTDSARSSRTGSPAGSSSSKPGSSRAASNSTANAASNNKGSTSAVAYGSAKDRIAAQIAALKSPQKLNVVKRDTRTIEEIERDMRARKAKQNGTSALSSTTSASGPAIGSRPLATGKPARSSTVTTQNSLAKGAATDRNGRRPRSPAYSDDSDPEDYSSSSSSADRPARKRARRHEQRRGNSSGLREDQRSAIWKLMGRDWNRDMAREQEFDSDDSNMEATGEDVLREERQAARLAAREDAAEQARERKRAEEKAKRKLAQSTT